MVYPLPFFPQKKARATALLTLLRIHPGDITGAVEEHAEGGGGGNRGPRKRYMGSPDRTPVYPPPRRWGCTGVSSIRVNAVALAAYMQTFTRRVLSVVKLENFQFE
jgi:hypothetical protein